MNQYLEYIQLFMYNNCILSILAISHETESRVKIIKGMYKKKQGIVYVLHFHSLPVRNCPAIATH